MLIVNFVYQEVGLINGDITVQGEECCTKQGIQPVKGVQEKRLTLPGRISECPEEVMLALDFEEFSGWE